MKRSLIIPLLLVGCSQPKSQDSTVTPTHVPTMIPSITEVTSRQENPLQDGMEQVKIFEADGWTCNSDIESWKYECSSHPKDGQFNVYRYFDDGVSRFHYATMLLQQDVLIENIEEIVSSIDIAMVDSEVAEQIKDWVLSRSETLEPKKERLYSQQLDI